MEKLKDLLRIEPGVTAIAGSGGKTAMLRTLAAELKSEGFVILTATTKMFPLEEYPIVEWEPFLHGETCTGPGIYLSSLTAALKKWGCVSTGELLETGKLTAPGVEMEELARAANYVIAEADGSRQLPIKAHGDYEPVVPECANQVIAVAGLWGLGKPVSQAVHRPEIFCRLAGCRETDMVTPRLFAKVFNMENSGKKAAGKLFLNGLREENRQEALEIKELVNLPVFAGNLDFGPYCDPKAFDENLSWEQL